MNPFQKNPFTKTATVHIVGCNKQFDDKQKISNIKENMTKLKLQKKEVNNNLEKVTLSTKDKVDILKNINRY